MASNSREQRGQDFAQLQKEYRLMEMNRKAYAEESHQVLRKQQASLEKLRHDNEALKTELAMEMRHHARPNNLAQQKKETLKLRDEADRFQELIEQERYARRIAYTLGPYHVCPWSHHSAPDSAFSLTTLIATATDTSSRLRTPGER
mmetsp:Transcript_72325/g.205692  ORF Transcript_72325/g.205692 Transcript_72325/m.205692 type:complete len:147 (-) Transcript_72325:1631-2071(-)